MKTNLSKIVALFLTSGSVFAQTSNTVDIRNLSGSFVLNESINPTPPYSIYFKPRNSSMHLGGYLVDMTEKVPLNIRIGHPVRGGGAYLDFTWLNDCPVITRAFDAGSFTWYTRELVYNTQRGIGTPLNSANGYLLYNIQANTRGYYMITLGLSNPGRTLFYDFGQRGWIPIYFGGQATGGGASERVVRDTTGYRGGTKIEVYIPTPGTYSLRLDNGEGLAPDVDFVAVTSPEL